MCVLMFPHFLWDVHLLLLLLVFSWWASTKGSVWISSRAGQAHIPPIGLSGVVRHVIISKGQNRMWCPLIVLGLHTQTVVTHSTAQSPVTATYQGMRGVSWHSAGTEQCFSLEKIADTGKMLSHDSWGTGHVSTLIYMSCVLRKICMNPSLYYSKVIWKCRESVNSLVNSFASLPFKTVFLLFFIWRVELQCA